MKNLVLILFLLPLISMGQNWIQVGSDIDGEAAQDRSGGSVALSGDGKILAIGSYVNSGNGNSAGSVRVYKDSAGVWVQMGADIDGEAAGDQSGYSVSLSHNGKILAIGARLNSGNGFQAGHVRVYEYTLGSWTQVGADIDGESAGDQSGWSVSLDSAGKTVAIGAPQNDGSANNSGHVVIYENVSGAWSVVGQDIDGEAGDDASGWSVALDSKGTTIAIGARLNDGNGSNSGHVRVFKKVSGFWAQVGSDIDGEASGDQNGYSVALNSSGKYLAVGAIYNRGNGHNAGHVRVYKDSANSWVQVGADIDGESPMDRSGYSVSISSDGTIVAIGAILNDGYAWDAGHVRVYKYKGNKWMQLGSDIDGEAARDQSGTSLSLGNNGKILAIGAPDNDGAWVNAGHARVYFYCQNKFSSDTVTICKSYTWDLTGQSYTKSGVYTDTLLNTKGCDSIVTLILTINPSVSISDTVKSCNQYKWLANDSIYYHSGTYIDTVLTTKGCDSVVTLHLTIDTVNVSISQESTTLTSNATQATYQWIDCLTGLPIQGMTNQSYTAIANGSYKVVITQNGCVDTSECYSVANVGAQEFVLGDSKVLVYPNPTNEQVTIIFDKVQEHSVLTVFSATGQELMNKEIINTEEASVKLMGNPGIYLIALTSQSGATKYFRVVKE